MRRVAVVADSGGQGAIAAELAERLGLEVLAFTPATIEALAALLRRRRACRTRWTWRARGVRPGDLPEVVNLVANEVDAVVLTGYFASYAADSPSLETAELAAAARLTETITTTPVLVHTMRPEGPVRGVPAGGRGPRPRHRRRPDDRG